MMTTASPPRSMTTHGLVSLDEYRDATSATVWTVKRDSRSLTGRYFERLRCLTFGGRFHHVCAHIPSVAPLSETLTAVTTFNPRPSLLCVPTNPRLVVRSR